MSGSPPQHSRVFGFISRRARRPSQSSTLQPLSQNSPVPSSPTNTNRQYQYNHQHSYSPTNSDSLSHNHGMPEQVSYPDDLAPPVVPYHPPATTHRGDASGLSSRRSSFSDLKDASGPGTLSKSARPSSLSVNYVPAKFTKLHEQGNYAHRRAKQGGGRDAFARNASRMGQIGTVDDDEGVVFQLGKGGLKKKKPKLRWNRFKWILFAANSLLFCYGMGTLISAILVWLNIFYQSDVIRVGNRTELIISTVAAAMLTLSSLIGYAGIFLNNRTFLAVYTLLCWVDLGLMVAPGYMTYKQRTFNLEGKINLQWSRNLGTIGRLRIQDALRCCGYFSPYVEATQSPLCYSRSNFPGCKARYLHLERMVLETWYIVAFSLVPAQIFVIISALLCSNHITYRFGKGLTPKRYRLDLGSMAVIMDEYASQIAAQYGPGMAQEAMNRSSIHLSDVGTTSRHDLVDLSRDYSSGTGSAASPSITKVHSRLAPPAPSTGTGTASLSPYSQPGGPAGASGAALYDPRRDSTDALNLQASPYRERDRYEDADSNPPSNRATWADDPDSNRATMMSTGTGVGYAR